MAGAIKKITLDWSETGKTTYCIIRREADGYYCNDANGTFANAPADPYISLTEDGTIKGRYELSESREVWNDGSYTIAIYKQAGGSPAPASDTIIGSGEMSIVSDVEVINVLVSDKTGFSLSATGADLILKGSTFVQAIVAAVNEFATYGLTALNTLLVTTGIKAANVPALVQSDVRAAIGMSTANLDTQLSSLPLAVWNILTTDVGIIASSFGKKIKDWVLGSDNKALLSIDAQTGVVIPRVTLVDTTTTNTDMRGTNSAALASVCTETRLAELDAANLPTDIAGIPTVEEFEARTLVAADYTIVSDLGTLTEAGIDAIFDRNSSLGVSFETLINRIYQIANNKMTVADATGVIALRNIGDTGTIASSTVEDNLTTTTRGEMAW